MEIHYRSKWLHLHCLLRTVRFVQLSDFRNCDAPVLQNCLLHIFHEFWLHQGRSTTTVFIVYSSSAFSELPSPSSDHTVAHNVGSIHMAQLVVDLYWRLLLSALQCKEGKAVKQMNQNHLARCVNVLSWNILYVYSKRGNEYMQLRPFRIIKRNENHIF